jgi:hypothetical protein
MIANQESFILSPYSELYELVVPKDNLLRQIKELVDFSFILEELKENYCLDNGRNAIPPIRMFKYLLLKCIYDVSDVDVVERSKFDMSFKYFLDMAPEEPVIDPSSLTKFRRLRLKNVAFLDLLINRTVEIAIEKGIIKSNSIIVDATHSSSYYNQKSPKEFLQDKSKNLRKAIYRVDESIKKILPAKSTSNEVEDELEYCNNLISVVESQTKVAELPAVKEKLCILKEVVEDFSYQMSYSNDPDARVGHKTQDTSFFGYKTHLALSDERIITAAVITTGEKSDGKQLQDLIEKSQSNGINVKTVIGDAAYSEFNNIQYTNKNNIELISKLHPLITNGRRNKEEEFQFNKDAGMFVCKAGHMAIRKKIDERKNQDKNPRIKYFFDIEKCKVCPFQEGCYIPGAKTKSYSVTIKSEEHRSQEALQNTDRFKELSKSRYKIEAKNSELKNRHGYKNATYSGLFGMEIQGATTIFAANLKRIIKLLQEKS